MSEDAESITRVYKFLNLQYAQCAVNERRLKVGLIDELNDPFELLAVDVTKERGAKFATT